MKNTTTTPDQQQHKSGNFNKTAHDEVARAAYCLYEKNGSQNGHDVGNWLEAEAYVKTKHASPPSSHFKHT